MLQACSQRRHVQEEQQKVELRLELLNLSDQCSEKLREVGLRMWAELKFLYS